MSVTSLIGPVEKHYVIHVNKRCCGVKVKVKGKGLHDMKTWGVKV